MQYYDPERDTLVSGIYFSAELLAFLRDVMSTETDDQDLKLSPQGRSGLYGLLSMIEHCIRHISRQLYGSDAWRIEAALYDYLREHPEAEETLHQFLNRAKEQRFTAWEDISLGGSSSGRIDGGLCGSTG